MQVIKIAGGYFGENTYVAGDEKGCIIVDPGSKVSDIMAGVEKLKSNVEYIVLTHMHYDHISSLDEIKSKTGAKVICHKDDAAFANDPIGNCSFLFDIEFRTEIPDTYVEDGSIITAGETQLRILHTPGHTNGSICIYQAEEKILFTGDTLFCMSVGRTDLGGGNEELLLSSIKNKLLTLPDDTVVYPGHGKNTNIGFEKSKNYYLWGNI